MGLPSLPGKGLGDQARGMANQGEAQTFPSPRRWPWPCTPRPCRKARLVLLGRERAGYMLRGWQMTGVSTAPGGHCQSPGRGQPRTMPSPKGQGTGQLEASAWARKGMARQNRGPPSQPLLPCPAAAVSRGPLRSRDSGCQHLVCSRRGPRWVLRHSSLDLGLL